MKKIFNFIWSFFALSFIIFLLLKLAFFYLKVAYPDLNLILVSLLISVIVLIFLKKIIFLLSDYLLKIYFSILSGIFVSLLIFSLLPRFDFLSAKFIIKLSIAFFLGFLITFLFSLKKTIRGLYFTLFFLIFGITICFTISEMQKAVLKNYENKLQEIGFSFNLNEIIPFKYSKPQCEGWFEKIKIFSDDKNEIFKNFYNEFIISYQEDKFLKFLREGSNPKEEILKDPKIKDKIWEEFLNYNPSIKEEMDKCPYVQWFEPLEYKDNLFQAPIPNLLSLMRFSRILQTSSMILQAEGKDLESKNLLTELYEASQKLKIKGQPLIVNLVRIAMEKIYLIGEAGAISMGGKLTNEKLERIEKISKDDLSTTISSFNLDFFTIYSLLKDPKNFSYFININEKVLKYIPKFIKRAIIFDETKNYLHTVFDYFEYLKKLKPEENKFFWKENKGILYKKSLFLPNLNSAFGRNLVFIAQARAILLSNEIFNYYNQNKKLPENIDFFENSNFIDPFSEEKIIYKKIDEEKFLVYSIGWDEKDDGGNDLYISGVVNFEKLNQDIGFCFSVK